MKKTIAKQGAVIAVKIATTSKDQESQSTGLEKRVITKEARSACWQELKKEAGTLQDAVATLLQRLQSAEARNSSDLQYSYDFALFISGGQNFLKNIKPHKSGRYSVWKCHLFVLHEWQYNTEMSKTTRVVVKDGKEQVQCYGTWLAEKKKKREKRAKK